MDVQLFTGDVRWHVPGLLEWFHEEPAVFVRRDSHHVWTHLSQNTDQETVKGARLKIWQRVKQWLQEAVSRRYAIDAPTKHSTRKPYL